MPPHVGTPPRHFAGLRTEVAAKARPGAAEAHTIGEVRQLRPFKLAFIGSHGVGKTTLCYGLAARLKASDVSLEIVHEVARRCPLPINEKTSVEAQSWILHTQIAEELSAVSRYPAVICDRSILDNYVYLLQAVGPQETLEELVRTWMSSYDLLVHVPVVETPAADGVRATDPSFQQAVDQRLRQELARRGLQFLSLDNDDRSAWLARVEAEVLRQSSFGDDPGDPDEPI